MRTELKEYKRKKNKTKMSIKYTEPHSIKPKLLAWSEVNLNEAETLINLFQSQSSHDCYWLIKFYQNYFIYFFLTRNFYRCL